MAEHTLLRLVQDLEWLGCELEFFGHKHALEGFPGAGPTWDAFLQKQQGVLTTVDKIDRELKGAVRFDAAALMGLDSSVETTLDSIAELLRAVEEIRQSAYIAVHDLPSRVRNFTKMVESCFVTANIKSR